MTDRQRTMLRVVLGIAFLALIVVWIVVLVAETDGDSSSTTNQSAFGHLTGLLVLALFTYLVHRLGTLPGFVIGKDNRVSTSKLQVFIWTYVIAGALMSLVAATWVGPDTGFDALTDDNFDFEPYLVLLGGPFAAAVLARVLVGSQVQSGEAAKPPGEPSASQAVSNDDGNADLVDGQYLLFNFVALAFFLGAFVADPTDGFPDIPTLLYALTGASAAGYVSNKAIAGLKPKVTSVYPARGAAGTEIEIFGLALLHPLAEGAGIEGGSTPDFHTVRVLVGDRAAPVTESSLTHTKSGDDRLKATVPTGIPEGVYDVKVLNFRGTPSEATKFEVTT
jgi:hypothetical protein